MVIGNSDGLIVFNWIGQSEHNGAARNNRAVDLDGDGNTSASAMMGICGNDKVRRRCRCRAKIFVKGENNLSARIGLSADENRWGTWYR